MNDYSANKQKYGSLFVHVTMTRTTRSVRAVVVVGFSANIIPYVISFLRNQIASGPFFTIQQYSSEHKNYNRGIGIGGVLTKLYAPICNEDVK